MALALGTNSGFVTVAPTADPAETGATIDGNAVVTKDTSPAGATKITSIGWYRASGTNTANWEIALYSDLAGVPVSRLFVDATNSTASNGWLTTTVDWDIATSTPYWLALQMDAHSGSSSVDSEASGGAGSDLFAASTLADPYAGGAVADADGMYAIYALISVLDTTDDLLADDVATGTPTLTSAVIGQIHSLNANDMSSGTPTLTSAVIGQTHVLTADDVSTGTPTLTSPALAELVALTADDIDAGTPTLTSPAVWQVHIFIADSISNEPILDTPILSVQGGEAQQAEPAAEEQASNWGTHHRRIFNRLSDDELATIVREQRIALGILQPDLPGQAIGEPEEIAREVAAAVNDQAVMADAPLDYETIYRAAYLEAEYAIAEYGRLKRRRRAAISLLLH